jgi:hypothetical protein
VILPTDIPTHAEIDRLLEYRGPWSVSIYLPTDPASNGEPERVELKTQVARTSSQLREAVVGAKVVRGFEDEIARRAWLSDARVLAVRDHDIPGGSAVAAILRYPL